MQNLEEVCTAVCFPIKLPDVGKKLCLKNDPTQVFSSEFCEIFQTIYFTENLWTAASW